MSDSEYAIATAVSSLADVLQAGVKANAVQILLSHTLAKKRMCCEIAAGIHACQLVSSASAAAMAVDTYMQISELLAEKGEI